MFALAILIGIYSYVIFSLGAIGILYKGTVLLSSFVFLLASYLYFKKNPAELPRINIKNKKIKPFLLLFGLMAAVNLIGALGPELSFDALWYHLTIPKIFIEEHRIFHIPGGLFYYSLMPKLSEMLFIPALMFGNEIIAKLIQWVFGILTSFVIYKISRKYFDEKLSILSSLIFYSSLVVAWESTTAYVDLIRVFFESMALWGFLEFYRSKNKKWLIESSVMVGLAISTKINALATIPIFIVLIFLGNKNKKIVLKESVIYFIISILIASPWFFFSYLSTGNPVFPFFSNHLKDLQGSLISLSLLNPIVIFKTYFNLFLKAADPITPVYIVLLPILFLQLKKINKEQKLIAIYVVLALILWYPFAQIGGSRFILPYLPAFSILTVFAISNTKSILLRKYLIGFIILVCFITVGYRGIANARYLPVILGQESKEEFLSRNLNFDFGDFYDADGWFSENIKEGDRVLLYGFHNLYYVKFPFIHNSYAIEGEKFNYIATQDSILPKKFSNWNLIYANELTNVRVYSLGGMQWSY